MCVHHTLLLTPSPSLARLFVGATRKNLSVHFIIGTQKLHVLEICRFGNLKQVPLFPQTRTVVHMAYSKNENGQCGKQTSETLNTLSGLMYADLLSNQTPTLQPQPQLSGCSTGKQDHWWASWKGAMFREKGNRPPLTHNTSGFVNPPGIQPGTNACTGNSRKAAKTRMACVETVDIITRLNHLSDYRIEIVFGIVDISSSCEQWRAL